MSDNVVVKPSISLAMRNAFRVGGIKQVQAWPGEIDYILDSETTGLSPYEDEIIQLAVIDFTTGETLLNRYMIPSVPISSGAQRVHGKTIEWLKENNASTFKEVYDDIFQLLLGSSILAYSATFDASMLDNMCVKQGLDPIQPLCWYDAMIPFALIHGEWSSYRKEFAWKKLSNFNINNRQLHDAVSDCLVVHDFCQTILKG